MKTEDTKGVIRSRNSKKDRKYNCQKNKDNDLQITQKTKAWATWTPRKTHVYSGSTERLAVPSGNCRVSLVANLVINAEWRIDGIVITTEELMGWWLRERNGRDCDYDRGMDGIVITTVEWTSLWLRQRNWRDCEYEREMDWIVITTEEWMGFWIRERNGRDCDYDRGMDWIVIATEEWTGLWLRQRSGRDCDYDRGLDGIVITT
jgi:hypothetical protein